MTPVYFGKKLSFSKELPFFCFSAVFLCPICENFVYFISKTANRLRLYKTLTIIHKTKTFSQKKRKNIVTKPILSKILADCLNFLFIFKVFSSFLQFNSQNLQTNFVSYQKNFCFFLFR